MIDLKCIPCLRQHFENVVDGEQTRAEGVGIATNSVEQQVQAYPSKSLVLQNGQYRVTDSEK